MNSFSNVERAIHFEVDRQIGLRQSGQRVEHQTMLWDAARNEARPMRSKEESHDYRYFPEPDLPPLWLGAERIEQLRSSLPEMPWARQARFHDQYRLSSQHAELLTATQPLADYFEEVARFAAEPQEGANWVMGEVLSAVNAQACSIADFPVRPQALGELLKLLGAGTISRPVARQVFFTMVKTGETAKAIVEAEGLTQVKDEGALQGWVDQVIRDNPQEAQRFRGGDAKLMGFFVGQVMRLSSGKADPKQVNALVREKLTGGTQA
jgi:aspartyl-tRNA(Asn)/glutamyl-tRNA(Gln) amidotransferase subunit B